MTPESTIKAAEDIKIMFELPVLGMSTVLTVVASAVSVLVTDVVQIENNTANTYTLSITCINAVNYANSHNMSLPAAIPSDGVILKSVTDEFNTGDSVMKVLKSTLKANGISYQITSGGYVRSISGLAEFDCGQGSGWMYKVNGIRH